MANFDVAAGLRVTEMNKILSQYYVKEPLGSNNPFNNSVTKNVSDVGSVTVNWKVFQTPTLQFGPPSQMVWDNAINAQGSYNKDSHTPLPINYMVQLLLPALDATYSLNGSTPIGGETKNVIAYSTVSFSGKNVAITPVAVTLDEGSFSVWDKAIFNQMLLPHIFFQAQGMLSVIHIPELAWNGISFNDPIFSFTNDLLVAASTLSSNSNPIDIQGTIWPTDDLFILANPAAINQALAIWLSSISSSLHTSDTGDFQNLADWSYSGSIENLQITIDQISAATLKASGVVRANAGCSLTTLGMGLATLACPLGGALLASSEL